MTPAFRPDANPQAAPQAHSTPKGYTCACAECGATVQSLKQWAGFCSTACRKAFNNRRSARGTILYDLFMASRFERKAASKLGLWAIMCRLASLWRSEDHDRRAGRQSWQAPATALSRLTYIHAVTIVRKSK